MSTYVWLIREAAVAHRTHAHMLKTLVGMFDAPRIRQPLVRFFTRHLPAGRHSHYQVPVAIWEIRDKTLTLVEATTFRDQDLIHSRDRLARVGNIVTVEHSKRSTLSTLREARFSESASRCSLRRREITTPPSQPSFGAQWTTRPASRS